MTSAPPSARAIDPHEGTNPPRFGVMVYPDRPLPELIEQVQRIEALGFDQVFVPDHIGDLRDLRGPWFDPYTVLAAAALRTETIRIGTLVSNPILRAPAILAKQAITLDHLSGGRFDLGIGAGVFAWDHTATGTEPWTPKERAGRFGEYVAIVDGILRGGEPFTFEGTWQFAREVPTAPGSFQRPRPPIIVGGQSPTVLRVAARYADVWNTIGPMGVGADEILETTARQNHLLDELTEAAGRDPATLRRSYALYGPFDPWESPVSFAEVIDQFREIGMTEFVTNVPPDDRLAEFDALARDVIPALRQR